MSTPVSPTFLKQEAKKLQKITGKSRSHALHEIAKRFGYSNWQHYLNVSKTLNEQSKLCIEDLLIYIFLENDLQKKMDLAISYIKQYGIPLADILDIFKLFHHLEGDIGFIYNKLLIEEKYQEFVGDPCLQYMGENLKLMNHPIQSYLFKDFLTQEGESEIQFRCPNFIAKEVSIHDLTYQLNENCLEVAGQYDLICELDCDDIPADIQGTSYCKANFFGIFVMQIDASKKIQILHSEIVEEIDGVIYKNQV